MKNQECNRMVRVYRPISYKDTSSTWYDTGGRFLTKTTPGNCHPDKNGIELIVSARQQSGEAMRLDDRIELQNAKMNWRRTMRKKQPNFNKRKYKYITLMKVEG